ncbi:hypothetical protein MT418_002462 [Batrachochytrium dendrobatidis]
MQTSNYLLHIHSTVPSSISDITSQYAIPHQPTPIVTQPHQPAPAISPSNSAYSRANTPLSIKATRPYSPVNENLLIHAFQKMDLEQEERAMSEWQKRKRHQRVSSTFSQSGFAPECIVSSRQLNARSQTPINMPGSRQTAQHLPSPSFHDVAKFLEHPEKIAELDSQHVDLLIKLLEQNKQSYQRWLESKAYERKLSRAKDLAEAKKQRTEQERKAAREIQQRLNTKMKLDEWKRKKDLERLKEQVQSHDEMQQIKTEVAQRRKEANKAYHIWYHNYCQKQKELSMSENAHLNSKRLSSRQQWVDTLPNSIDTGMTSKSRSKMSRNRAEGVEPLLSPPHLYQDYTRCKLLVPDYVRKYGVQVASAGMGLALDHVFQNESV